MSPDWPNAFYTKMTTLFISEADREGARYMLTPVIAGEEGYRVAVACLKLAGADLAELKNCVEAGIKDYRDILAWAESPRQMQLGPGASPADRARARRDDAEDYTRWLRGS